MNRNRVNKKRMGGVCAFTGSGWHAGSSAVLSADDSAGRTGGRFFSYIVILECGTGRRLGRFQFGKYRQLWRFDFCSQWKCERGHIGAWRVPGDGE